MEVLPRIDTAPLQDLQVPDDFKQWLANLVDTLNQVIAITEANLP